MTRNLNRGLKMQKATTSHLSRTIRANSLYQRADEHWRQGRVRSAFRLFLAAAEAGSDAASEIVGQFYDCGDGVKVDQDAALHWYRKAYRRGSDSAANNIGCIWRDRREFQRALLWFRRAVKLGDGDANLNIAKVYIRGSSGSKRAVYYLRETLKSRNVTQGSKEEARRLLKQLKSRNP